MRFGRLIHVVAILTAVGVRPVAAIDPPHLSDGSNGFDDCTLCHTPHGSAGGVITKVAGNANLCQSCHTSGQPAALLPFDEADQALPGPGLPAGFSPSGTSHRWDSGPAGHVVAGAGNTSTGSVQSGGTFSGRFAKTYTITITTDGDSGAAVFSWVDTQGGSATGVSSGVDVSLDEGITVTFTDGAVSPSFELGKEWYVHVLTDLVNPTEPTMLARLEDGKIMCSTCHNPHSQDATPFDPDAPVTPGEEGRHFQRIANDTAQMCVECHAARDVGDLASQGTGNLSHPVGLAVPGAGDYKSPTTLPLDSASNVACLTCHAVHDPDGSLNLPDDGTLTRLQGKALCEDCHTLAGGSASHMNASTGVLWPGGEYGVCSGGTNDGGTCSEDADCPGGGTCGGISSFPEITDSGQRGSCVNCHQPHGWADAATPAQDYASLLVANASAELCFTCHDGTGPAGADVYGKFNGSTNYQATAAPGALINQRHDVSVADQTYSSGAVACANCHNPHKATSSQKIIDPDTPATAYSLTYDTTADWTGTGNSTHRYVGSGIDDAGDPVAYDFTYYGTTSDLNPMNPIGCAAQPASIGPAVEGVHLGDDLGTSSGDYSSGTENQTYTVTVSTGGTPTAAEITVTSTGADSSGPTTVTAFDTPIDVGNFGVKISFQDGGSGGIPSDVGTAVCSGPCTGYLGTSGGTYTGSEGGTYHMEVTTGGKTGTAVLTCSNTGISLDATCDGTQTFIWQSNPDTFNLGDFGVTLTVEDTAGGASLTAGTTWDIPVTAASGDGVLTAGDNWTIEATVATAGCSTDPEPDMISFCLVCHDTDGGFAPVPGVTMSPGLVNIAAAYSTTEQHGRNAGNNGGNGFMKAPWQDVAGTDVNAGSPGTDPDGFSDAELPNPYAALQCSFCHDGHGSDNIYHLKTSITIRGQQMFVGGGPGSGFQGLDPNPDPPGVPDLRFTTASDHEFGDTTYRLPCFDGGGAQVSCTEPGSSQQDLKWGAWCSFCHDMQSHGQDEGNTCQTGHRHGGTRY